MDGGLPVCHNAKGYEAYLVLLRDLNAPGSVFKRLTKKLGDAGRRNIFARGRQMKSSAAEIQPTLGTLQRHHRSLTQFANLKEKHESALSVICHSSRVRGDFDEAVSIPETQSQNAQWRIDDEDTQ